ncbi:hypothetical protein ABEKA_2786 [Acinetobacter lwoffii]|nr:hypothetical protein ABEKA_2786 [Acinetobacter lwoffii]
MAEKAINSSKYDARTKLVSEKEDLNDFIKSFDNFHEKNN